MNHEIEKRGNVYTPQENCTWQKQRVGPYAKSFEQMSVEPLIRYENIMAQSSRARAGSEHARI
jgi:hypothetical protein